MKIAVVCHPTYGGSGVVATELAQGLARSGHEVHLVSYERPFRYDPLQPDIYYHQVDVSDYPLFRHPPYSLNLTNKLVELVEERGVEVVHSHYAIPHAQAAWMAREVLQEERGLDVKLACTLHGTDITLVGLQHSFFKLTRFTIQRQDLLTAPSAWLACETARDFHVDEERIHVIPNFVDLERFQPKPSDDIRRRLGAADRFVITHVSNFRPVKRVRDVVSGFANLRGGTEAVLVLVGDGPELDPAVELAQELGVRDDLRILGKMNDLEKILQASDLFFLPSRAESFGLAALEAQACGVPVIGYRTGGLPEVVVDGETGVLCPEGQDVCLGSIASDVLGDPTRHAAMRRAARRNAERFALVPVLRRYEEALRCLVSGLDPADVLRKAPA
ncbi:MAG: N-acetyl-alpha-D-glucosaminyl L-malate synthase BshA [Thermoanaerobaculia bacterium]|nr:N-acetyl-alpha-D-glucosaminyl L-malate synthase BshA [Thermoanaerobaculia bacterium]